LPQKRTSSRLRRKQRISFSLCTVIAERMPRIPAQAPAPAGMDASAIHGRTERSGCTAAEPYPLSRMKTLVSSASHPKK
jgi:hypothetical protein